MPSRPKLKQRIRRFFCLASPSDEPPEHEVTGEKTESARPQETLQARVDELAEEKRKLEDELRRVKDARDKDLANKDANLQQLGKTISELQAKKPTESPSAVLRIQELTAQLAEKDKLLAERTMELNAAQAFLTRVDAVSETEVVGMIESLNTLISSISGALDSWDHLDLPGSLGDELDVNQIRQNLGSSVFDQITIRNSVAVNLAIQMSLGYFIERITTGWGAGEVAGTLGEVYDMISTKESQTIASRWRTLTKRYIPDQDPPQDEEVMDDLARILVIIRSFSELSEAMEFVGNNAGTEIKATIEATLQLDNTIETKIASSDMSVYIVRPGAIFDEERMVDEFEGKGGENLVVAGTTEIGLLQRSGDGEKVLRKPKVILERDLPES